MIKFFGKNIGDNTQENIYQLKHRKKTNIIIKPKETVKTKISLLNSFNKSLANDPSLNLEIIDSNHKNSYLLEKDLIDFFKPLNLKQKTCLKVNVNLIERLNNFVLIIDFPALGGGTSFFINSIISKYKNNTNFLIARNIENLVCFNINNTYELDKKFNENESIEFLKYIKPKIIKIFVNHTLNHEIVFIKTLFTLEKEIVTITHDYSFLLKKHNPSYKEIVERNFEPAEININAFDKIITQNSVNTKIIFPFLKDKEKIIVSELPDFRNSGFKIENNSTTIVIGVIGFISKEKGEHILNDIIKFYKESKRVKIVVFGKTNINNFANSFIYNSIEELNKLLAFFKPNVLLEMSLWPETYCYTLTLAMLTQLPILYFKKPFDSVIENRLNNYKNAYSFESIAEFNNLIKKHNQNYLYTIEPIIYFNNFWDDYFSNKDSAASNQKINTSNLKEKLLFQLKIQNKNIVIITSKIYISKNPYSYANTRSIYTPEERFYQTIKTIESVKKYIPDSFIILFDNSTFQTPGYFYKLKNSVDEFINITDNAFLNYYTDVCDCKAFSELNQVIEIYKILFKNVELKNVKNLFKITGRYIINEHFDYSQYENNCSIIKKNHNITDRNYWYTCFYKIDKNFIHSFFERIQFILENKDKYFGLDLEVIFSKIFKTDFSFVDELGITQNIAVWKQEDNI